jgi:phage-related protein
MKFIRQSATALLLVGALCLPGLVTAQKPNQNHGHNDRDRDRMPPGRVQNNAPKPGKWLSEHLNLSPEQRQKELSKDPEFRQLNPEQQQHLQQRLNQFNSLPPEQQKRTLRRMQAMESLPQDRQEILRNSLQQLRQLPDDRRRSVRRAWLDLRQMPPDQQEQTMNSDRFRSTFNDQERATLKGLLDSGFNPQDSNAGGPR